MIPLLLFRITSGAAVQLEIYTIEVSGEFAPIVEVAGSFTPTINTDGSFTPTIEVTGSLLDS